MRAGELTELSNERNHPFVVASSRQENLREKDPRDREIEVFKLESRKVARIFFLG